MGEKQCFGEQTDQSYVKAAIVSKYFDAWANVIIPTARKKSGRIAYIDLFAGRGGYEDGAKSTPLLILEKAIKHADIRKNYKDAFRNLEIQGKIVADTPPDKRRKHKGEVTIADDLMFAFPSSLKK